MNRFAFWIRHVSAVVMATVMTISAAIAAEDSKKPEQPLIDSEGAVVRRF